MQQQIADCLKKTVGKYNKFDEVELIEVVEKVYNLFNAHKQEYKKEITKRKSKFSILTLKTMKKEDLKNVCTDFGI